MINSAFDLKFQVTAQLKILLVTPEHIWSAIESSKPYEATVLYLVAMETVDILKSINPQLMDPFAIHNPKNQDIKSVFFPYLVREASISSFYYFSASRDYFATIFQDTGKGIFYII